MADPSVSDEHLRRVLGLYAGMVGRVLADPGRWLGMDEEPPPTAGFPARALDAIHDRAFGEKSPASPEWSQEPVDRRVDWWVTRIGISAGLAAATPRFFGAIADRVPLQSALGAAASGLAVCATAREHGRDTPEEWVPLLATVLFHRELSAVAGGVPAAGEAERELADAHQTGDDDKDAVPAGRSGPARAAKTLWGLARAMFGLQGVLDERPRGGLLVRSLGKLPVVGVASGWLDERSGIRKAAEQTAGLVRGDQPQRRRGRPWARS